MQARCSLSSLSRAAMTLIGLGLVLAGGAGYTQVAFADTSSSVSIIDFDFQPAVLTVNPGDTVIWTNTGTVAHTTTSDTNMWDSSSLASGATFSFRFTTPGTYSYRCTIHPAMHGLIFVPSAPGQQPTSNDGQQFSTQSASTQAFFSSNFGDQAALEWVREHDAALPPQPAPTSVPTLLPSVAPAPAPAQVAPPPPPDAPPPPPSEPDNGPAPVPSY